MCCQIFLGVLSNLKMSKKLCKPSIFSLCWSLFLTLRCAAELVLKISLPQAQKSWEPLGYNINGDWLETHLKPIQLKLKLWCCSYETCLLPGPLSLFRSVSMYLHFFFFFEPKKLLFRKKKLFSKLLPWREKKSCIKYRSCILLMKKEKKKEEKETRKFKIKNSI